MSGELGPKARALIEATRCADDATQADADRVRTAVLARVAVGTTAAAGGVAATASAKPGAIASSLAGAASTAAAKSTLGIVALSMKVLACLGVATAVGVGATFAVRGAHDAPSRGGERSAQRAVVAPETDPPASPVATEATPPAASPPAELPAPSSQAPANGEARAPARTVTEASPLDAEVAILREARQALRDGRAARALALLDEHARRFPHGVLAEDCAAERVFALCAIGSVGQARAEGLQFLASHAVSPHADAVRASCGVGTRRYREERRGGEVSPHAREFTLVPDPSSRARPHRARSSHAE